MTNSNKQTSPQTSNNNLFRTNSIQQQSQQLHSSKNSNDFLDSSYLNFTQQQQQQQLQNLNITNSSSPSLEQRLNKTQRNTPGFTKNSQEDSFKYRLSAKTDTTTNKIEPNPNAYHDKVTDQKFFNRNYKIKNQTSLEANSTTTTSNSNDMTMSYNARFLNDTPSSNVESYQNSNMRLSDKASGEQSKNSFYTNQSNLNINSFQNSNLQSTSINLNRLKLLKKRNALKKTLSNAANLQAASSTTSKSQQNFEIQLHSSSKEDLKSQTSQNNLTNRALSMHMSRNSLNHIENSNLGSNQNILYHKSNETIDEHTLNELRLKESNKNSLNRVRSTPHIMMPMHVNHSQNGRTKSENELANLTENFKLKPKNEYDSSQEKVMNLSSMNKTLAANKNYLNRVKTVGGTSHVVANNANANSNQRPVSRLDNLKIKNTNIKPSLNITGYKENLNETNYSNVSKSKAYNDANNNEDFRIVYPGYNAEIIKPNTQQVMDLKLSVDAFEPSPYNIMSDPVISEQFRKLYEEDEYFQQVHKKCIEWLNKYVFPELELEKHERNSRK